MKQIALTLLISMSMIITTGYNTCGENFDESKVVMAEPLMYETVEFSNRDILLHYIKLAPYSIQVYFYTKQYCAEFNVPEEIAFAVAHLETTYRGPDKFGYNPTNQISNANAYGAYQLLLSTARDVYSNCLNLGPRYELTREILLNNVELNVKLGIRYLRWLKDNINTDWTIVCGFYNSGYPIINDYARYAVKIYNYKKRNL